MIKYFFYIFTVLVFSTISHAQKNQYDEDGDRHGFWKVEFKGTNNPKFEGTFEHGQEIGKFKFYKKGFYDHPSAIMNFDKAQDSVHVTYFTQTGKPISEGMMMDRKREGEWVYYHQKTDSIMMIENYKSDQLNGPQKTYFPNGKLAEKTHYTNGEKNGESFIYANNGQVTKELLYKDGLLHGAATYYDPKGLKIREGFYTAGEKSGHWKYFSDGKLDTEEDY
ncbi:aspartic peptidase [Gramella sp. MAR_2010_147]|uniref:toxin-antitoxin system YwqK family antitoxin n=1 Tax=Gramella sp. MAR_2010_147 TaxID=1250205 RepID=UPI000879E1F9|nr:aspartic peptidase [Gramella sp. MAR_2010_147]SDR66945.1 Antitoxin component YwqK of the YwqJK toxin-antitoxin module [Gramella sp. MAR_2010_147]